MDTTTQKVTKPKESDININIQNPSSPYVKYAIIAGIIIGVVGVSLVAYKIFKNK